MHRDAAQKFSEQGRVLVAKILEATQHKGGGEGAIRAAKHLRETVKDIVTHSHPRGRVRTLRGCS